MSRTVDAHLRKSRRLIENGYYIPTGESPSRWEQSSGDDDDAASIDSNNSSVYSERAVNYNESPPAHMRRRRRRAIDSPHRGMDSPHTKMKVSFPKSDPLLRLTPRRRAAQKLMEGVGHGDNEAPVLSSYTRKEHSSYLSKNPTTDREIRTTITSLKTSSYTSSQRFSRAEASSSMVQHSMLNQDAQAASSLTRVGMSQDRARMSQDINSRGEGDHAASQAAQYVSESAMQEKQAHKVTEAAEKEGNVQYSSSETEAETAGSEVMHQKALVPILFTNLIMVIGDIISKVGMLLAYLCQMFYEATLSLYVLDVGWLSKRTTPLFSKVFRTGIIAFLLLALLYVGYQAIRPTEESNLLLPLRSISSLLSVLSLKVSSIASQPESSTPDPVHTAYVAAPSSTEQHTASISSEEALNLQLKLAFEIDTLKKEIANLRQDEINRSKKLRQSYADDVKALENKIKVQIDSFRQDADRQAANDLRLLKEDVASIKRDHAESLTASKAETEKLRTQFNQGSQMSTKLNDFSAKFAAFDARLTVLNNLITKHMSDYENRGGNSTYLEEIAKMQFIESFLHLIKIDSEKKTDHQSNLHTLFLAWLKKQGFAHIEEVDRSTSNLHSSLNGTMAALETKITAHMEKMRKSVQKHTSSLTLEKLVQRPTGASGGSLASSEDEIKKWIREELNVYSADRIGLADHALESAGGFIVSTRCSESFNRKTALVSLFGIPIYYNINTPRSVIQASTLPGECWSFKGSEGYVVIALSGAVQPTLFTLEHIPRELSPHGRIDSAPKDFIVLGLTDTSDYTGKRLGEFRYDSNGPVIQQFMAVPQEDYFTHVELRISSNWGHPDYTCLYRFRVHGTRREANAPPF